MLYRRYGKRLFDLTLATLGLVLASPVLGLIALAVKLTSRGPVFYVQERIGKDGVPFPFIKFRTMVVGAESQGAGILCLKDDPRVTRVGRLLRRFSLDEAPQLFNVLRGEMSLIGPRPGLAYQVRAYTPFQRRRLTVLPGITGWAQVNGRNAIAWDQRIVRDVEYVEQLSLAMDLRILRRTARAVLKSDTLIAERDYFKTREARLQSESVHSGLSGHVSALPRSAGRDVLNGSRDA
jgi:lipopolysaccharide/colanic/teichoic acid biosynthesis glycosyltransferase